MVEKNYSGSIDFYNIQYYDQGAGNYYITETDIFESDGGYNASVNELVTAGIPANKIVVGKIVPSLDTSEKLDLWSETDETTMTTIVQQAFQSTTENVKLWSSQGGIMVWLWQSDQLDDENTQIQNYMKDVVPPS